MLVCQGLCERVWADDAGPLRPDVRARTTRHPLVRPPEVPSDEALASAHARIGKVSIVPRIIFDTARR